MSVLINYPYPLLEHLLILPNPAINDGESPDTDLLIHRTIGGENHVYVRENKDSELILTLEFKNILRFKLEETKTFIRNYTGFYVRYNNQFDEQFKMRIVNSPTFVYTKRASPGNPARAESGEFNLVLQGVRI